MNNQPIVIQRQDDGESDFWQVKQGDKRAEDLSL